MELNKALAAHGFNKKQIESFMFYYEQAIQLKIPYPYYYAMINIVS